MDVDLAADLDLALDLARTADEITMGRFRASDLIVETKPDLTPVTEADQRTEHALRSMLAQHRPDDGVLGEEFGSTGSGPRQWIIDPIDATKNYVRGVPVWATLIALAVDDEVVVGVASAPALGRRWWAASGSGAWLSTFGQQAERLSVSAVRTMADASLSYSDSTGWAEGLRCLTEATWRQRAYGDFWSHLLVAEGSVDVSAEPELGPWDIAALIPIIREAGGQVTSFDGTPAMLGGSALASNGLLHDQALALLSAR